MSNEPRHGPVTMHRAVERAMLHEIAHRPSAAARTDADADGTSLGSLTGAGAEALRDAADAADAAGLGSRERGNLGPAGRKRSARPARPGARPGEHGP